MTTVLPDKDLVKRIQNGDILSFEILVRKYQAKLLGYAVRICKDESLAEEAVQDAFLGFYKNIDRIDVNGNISSYLYKIAKNNVYNFIRKSKNNLSLNEAMHVDSGQNIIEDFFIKERSTKVKEILKSIDKKYHDVLKLYYLDGLSHKEIKNKLSLSLGTIKTRIRRGKIYFRRAWENK